MKTKQLYAYLFIIVASLSSFGQVHSDSLCTNKRPTRVNEQNCEIYCSSKWGKAPLLNKPWAHGKCSEFACVCRFNYEDLGNFFPKKCIHITPYVSLETKIEKAKNEYEAQISQMNLMERFSMYIKAYRKKYASKGEQNKRFEIFADNLLTIDRLMAKRIGNLVYGIGPFTDLTREEYSARIGIIHKSKPGSGPKGHQLQPRMLRSWFSSASKSTKSESRRSQRSKSSSRSKRSSSAFPDTRGTTSRGRSRDRETPPPGRSKSAPTPSKSRSRSPKKRERLIVGMDPASSSSGGVDKTPPTSWVGKDPSGNPVTDWRHPANIYPPIESQTVGMNADCQSCWAFSVLGAVEINWAWSEEKVTMLSKQDLLDCVAKSNGCEGGAIFEALEHMKIYGVAKAADYPYTAKTGRCNKNVKRYLMIEDYVQVKRQKDLEEYLLYSALASVIHAPDNLQHYVSGIYNSADCSGHPKDINHAVTIVGHYKEAWILRNSYGPDWGYQGHYLVEKGKCGIGLETYAIDGIYEIEEPTAKKARVEPGSDEGST